MVLGILLVLGAVAAGVIYTGSFQSIAEEKEIASITPAAGEPAQDSANDDALESEDEKVQAAENAVTPEPDTTNTDEVAAKEEKAEEKAPAPAATPQDELAKLTTPRILGDSKSPVKITEHSSFTCGACAHYHGDNFKKIKADYIDTGKAYLVFDDFPRNAPDLEIGMVARCLPETSYFNFVQLLFETQEKWASETEFKKYVKQNAILAGLAEDKYEECLKNADLQKSLAEHREAAVAKFGVKGTPTLVINDKTVISGMAPYNQIKEALDAEYAKAAK